MDQTAQQARASSTLNAGALRTPTVRRTRLLARLSAASTPAVVISAAAGSGKSTLAAQWSAADDRPHATRALAPHLDDAAALAGLLVDALEQVGPLAPHTRAAITAAEPAFSAIVLPAITELTRSRPDPFVLVLDDAHLLQDPMCHALLEAVCDGLPARSTLALVTRDAAPAWMGRARAEGRLTEIRDLAFDDEEASRLFAKMDVAVDAPSLTASLAASEGWAVGLYLAALARRDGDGASAPGDFRRYIGDYLRSQVLDPLDPPTREFLVRTAVLEELTGPLGAAVTQRTDAEALLADLSRRIQLVIELDGEPRRFRYHHLLADHLRQELQSTDPTAAATVLARAATWCADHGELDRAIRYAKASGDLALTGRLVWSGIIPCIGSGRPDRLRSWLSDLPDGHLASDPWLALAASWLALQEGDGARTQRWTLVAERHAGRAWAEQAATDEFAASLATLRVLIGMPLAEAVTLATRALAGLPADSQFRAPAAWLRGVAQVLLGHVEEGTASIVESRRYADALDVPVIRADALAFLGVLAILGGERDAGVRQIREAVGLVDEFELDRLATSAHTVTAQALALATAGDRRAAEAALAKARRLSTLTDGIAPWFAVLGRLIQSRTALLLGDGATARVLVDEGARLMSADLAGTLAEVILDETRALLQSAAFSGGSAVALTSAELRVLQYLPSHLSFPQIGAHLFLSQNTIKTHALAIYRKFGVSSRGEAVERARQLGLVEPPAHD